MSQSVLVKDRSNTSSPVLEVKGMQKYFPIQSPFGRTKGYVQAVEEINFTLYERKTLGIVGESGCGKSTTGRTLLRLIEPTKGEAIYRGKDIFKLKGKELLDVRKDIQMVFQDPHSSLDPKKRIGSIIEEPMEIHKMGSKADRIERAMDLLKKPVYVKINIIVSLMSFQGDKGSESVLQGH